MVEEWVVKMGKEKRVSRLIGDELRIFLQILRDLCHRFQSGRRGHLVRESCLRREREWSGFVAVCFTLLIDVLTQRLPGRIDDVNCIF